ncbi:uncharacterized protein LOC128387906 [Panonychus citri]|uniref:uncharacterized protein LOC128386227 n=1 Tax=Panonychus citri TaxID=50023 RepID=UPI002307964A|nr:uncharacterized protein LOC128386227 [Panonychus citri]XP_053203168.1 uncharacterized protein LOC128387906 [Panonychus citri]
MSHMDGQLLTVYKNSVYFGVHKFTCKEVCLTPRGIKFIQVLRLEDFSFSDVAIPPNDVQRAYFDSKTGDNLSTLITETIPESGIKICKALQIKPNQAHENTQEGSIRVLVQFSGQGEEIYKILDEYFSCYTLLTWKLQKVLSRSVHKYLDFLNNHSQQSSTRKTNVSSPNYDNSVFNMEVNQTLSVHNDSVYFGVHRFSCKEICLISAGIKFVRVSSPGRPDFVMTIPPIDIQRAYFDNRTELLTLIVETVPSSSFKICEALKIKANQCELMEGTIRIAVQLKGKSEEMQKILEEYFAIFNSVTWKLDRTLSLSVHQYFDFLNNYSRQPTTTSSSTFGSPLASKKIPVQIGLKTESIISNLNETTTITWRKINSGAENATDRNLTSPNSDYHSPARQSDLACLEEGQSLNHTVLDFYLKYIEKDVIAPNIAERSYIFSPFFYHKLTHRLQANEVETLDCQTPSDRYYNRVKNWTKDINIFQKDFLIIPVNKKNCHWCVVIICYPRKVPFVGSIERKRKIPCMLIMDSLQGNECRKGCTSPIRHFLIKEWESMKMAKKSFSKISIPDIYLKVPKQNNDFDSGLYVLQYIESFLRDPDDLLERIHKDTSIDLRDWFSQALISSKRRTLESFIKRKRKSGENKKNECETMETDDS